MEKMAQLREETKLISKSLPNSKLAKLFNWNLKGTVNRKNLILSLFKEYSETGIFNDQRVYKSLWKSSYSFI